MRPLHARIKICGLTRPEDARTAVQCGADAIGLNLVGGPRRIGEPRARDILRALPANGSAWVLLNVSDNEARETLHRLNEVGHISHVQLYGVVTPEAISQLRAEGFQTAVVRHAGSADFLARTDEWLTRCGTHPPALLLLDSGGAARSVEDHRPQCRDTPAHRAAKAAGPVAASAGGTGQPWDWKQYAYARDAGTLRGWPPIVLAGGLVPENVAEAIRAVRPAWVDVSSGVELPSNLGVKDAAKIAAFIAAARSVTSELNTGTSRTESEPRP